MLRSMADVLRKEEARMLEDILASFPINDDRNTAKLVGTRCVDYDSLFQTMSPDTRIDVEIERKTDVLGEKENFAYREVVLCDTGSKMHSLSLTRPPGMPDDNPLGSVFNLPFLPGGMEEDWEVARKKALDAERDSVVNFDIDYKACPPGFSNGIDYSAQLEVKKIDCSFVAKTAVVGGISENLDIFDIMDFLSENNDGLGAFSSIPDKIVKRAEDTDNEIACKSENDISDDAVEDLLEKPVRVANVPTIVDLGSATKDKTEIKKIYKWAKWIDVNQPVDDFQRRVPQLAHTYPFELDTFQKQAVLHLESGDTVFVAAHTSAGKTVVAEYAIALCRKHLTKAVYTSPIKALSNQKFRDFKQTFGDVGLITGDIQLNPESSCLIMTTEILRSMLLNGSKIVRELEWVIFDEVHYINDIERGVVWEEVLIFLPSHCKIAMLSATVSNVLDFADWVGQIKQRNVYVISTPKRPVPLEHFLYTGSDGKTKNNRFLLVDKRGTFIKKGYDLALASKSDKKKSAPYQSANNPKTERNMWIALIDHLKSNDLLPSVCFTFSRKRCDENAGFLKNVDLTTNLEKQEIHFFFSRCLNRLQPVDRKLPQIKIMQELCTNGLAVHHSGILPIMKETVEMLFQQGFVKVLFATETFAMGVNMPARTVVFDSTRKHDGKHFRDLEPHEYTQMAGRAGRRGLDKTGTVVILCKKEVPEQSDLHRFILGKPAELDSRFRVTYSLLLNLLRVEGFRIEDILKKSFAENVTLREAGKNKERLKFYENTLKYGPELKCSICTKGDGLEKYYKLCRQLWQISRQLNSKTLRKKLSIGCYLTFSRDSFRNALAIFLQYSSGESTDTEISASGGSGQKITLFTCKSFEAPVYFNRDDADEEFLSIYETGLLYGQRENYRLAKPILNESPDYLILSIDFNQVIHVFTKNVKPAVLNAIKEDVEKRKMPKHRNAESNESVVAAVRELQRLSLNADKDLPATDPYNSKDLNVTSDPDLLVLVSSLRNLKSKLSEYDCVHCLNFQEHFTVIHTKNSLEDAYENLKFQLSDAGLLLSPAYKQKLQVLRDLQYVDRYDALTLKGQVACRINQCELLISEMMLENMLIPLTCSEIAAVLSCVTCQQKITEQLELPENLNALKLRVEELAVKIYEAQKRNGADDADPMETLRFDLMEVVFEWANGTPFYQIMQKTSAQEGVIVRCIQRLDEVCRDVKSAAKVVGNPTLQRKMEETSTLIKRDIVFAASLYTSL